MKIIKKFPFLRMNFWQSPPTIATNRPTHSSRNWQVDKMGQENQQAYLPD
jgi:hypothetical protein